MRQVVLSLLIAFLSVIPATAARRRAVRQPGTPPSIKSITPASGPISGGTDVTLRGSGFFGEITVQLDGQTIAARVESSERISLTTPAHVNGFVSISVSNRDSRATTEFLYVPPAMDAIPNGYITTVAGIGNYIGEGRSARDVPIVATDFAVAADGTAYLAENSINLVRRVLPEGAIERFAGNGLPVAPLGDGGPALEATLSYPNDVKIGPDGAVYIVDSFNHRIRRVDPRTNVITTVAGSGPDHDCCSGTYGGDGGPATEAKLNAPTQVAFDPAGNLYILDGHNARIRRVGSGGIITTVAGTGVRGFSGDGGPATQAQIDPGPGGDYGAMKIDSSGNIYLADMFNRRVRRIDALTGRIDTVLGGGRGIDAVTGIAITLGDNFGIAVDRAGVLYFNNPSQILRLDGDGLVRAVLGRVPGFSDDGTPIAEARTHNPGRMHVDDSGDLYYLEFGGFRFRRAAAARGTIETIAGIGPNAFGENGPAIAALINPLGQAAVLDDDLVFGEGFRLVRLRKDGILQTIAGTELPLGFDSNAPREALKGAVMAGGNAVDPVGNIYVSDRQVARITPDGIYTPLTRFGRGFAGDGGPAKDALLDNAVGLALDSKQNIYIADCYNHRIRRIDATTAIITTIAGNAPPHPPDVLLPEPSTGDGGPATNARINTPVWIAMDAQDRLHLADTDRIRRIEVDGTINTVLSSCFGPLASSRGRVFVLCNNEVRRIDGPEQWTVITRFQQGGLAMSGDGGPATEASLGPISGIAVNGSGDVFVMGGSSRRIRAIKSIARW